MLAKLTWQCRDETTLDIILDRQTHLGRSGTAVNNSPFYIQFEAHGSAGIPNHFIDGDNPHTPLGYTGVSRSHVIIAPAELGYVLQDLGSSYGTFVNGKKAEEPQVLLSDDEIVLAPEQRGTRFKYHPLEKDLNLALVVSNSDQTSADVLHFLAQDGSFPKSGLTSSSEITTGDIIAFIDRAARLATKDSTTLFYFAGGLDSVGNYALADGGLDPALFFPYLRAVRGRKLVVVDVPDAFKFQAPREHLPYETIVAVPQRRNMEGSDVPISQILTSALRLRGRGTNLGVLDYHFFSEKQAEPNYQLVIPASIRPSGKT